MTLLTLIHIGMTLSIVCFYTGYYFRFKKSSPPYFQSTRCDFQFNNRLYSSLCEIFRRRFRKRRDCSRSQTLDHRYTSRICRNNLDFDASNDLVRNNPKKRIPQKATLYFSSSIYCDFPFRLGSVSFHKLTASRFGIGNRFSTLLGRI